MSVGYSARRPVPASAKHEHALGEGYHPGEVGRLGAERRRARHALPWASVSPLHRGGPAPRASSVVPSHAIARVWPRSKHDAKLPPHG
jgi:hypothetical protein